MKKLLLLVMAVFSTINAGEYESPPFINPNGNGPGKLGTEGKGAKIVQAAKEFKKTEQAHKAKWFDFAKEKHDAKFDLLKAQHNEWFDFGIKNIDNVAAINSKKEAVDVILNHFKGAYALIGKHMEEWKELCEKEYKEGMRIYGDQKKEHDAFAKYIK